MKHISKMLVHGQMATVISIETAIREDGEFIVKLDQVIKQLEEDVIVFDFSEVTKLDGKTVGLPMSHLRSLEHMGITVYVILSVEADRYLTARGIRGFFNIIDQTDLVPLIVAA